MKKFFISSIVLLALLILFFGFNGLQTESEPVDIINIEQLVEIEPIPAVDEYGFLEDELTYIDEQIQRNESLYIILDRHGLSAKEIYEIQQKSAGSYNLSRMVPGQKYRVYFDDEKPVSLVWHQTSRRFLTINFDEEINIEQGEIPLTKRVMESAGVINSSLYQTIVDQGGPRGLGSSLAEIFAWEIDFFALRRGDHYRVVYEQLFAGDDYVGIGDVYVAEFQHRGEENRAYFFNSEERMGYFDEEGKSMEKQLLKAPFRYNQRISSGFTNNRFHPILKRNRPHHGTDYAAPTGTPILAVGDGVVTESQRRGGNGNIVQIRHNNTYKTAYLHLNGFASGIRKGVEVEQGQVIGYVGQTGLATGPHLCYRLYVNNRPVNSVRADLPDGEPLDQEYMEEFKYNVSKFNDMLDDVKLNEQVASR